MQRKTDVDLAAHGATSWRPSATIATLRRRAELAHAIRTYFAARDVLEVQTPVLMPWGSPDPALRSFVARPDGADGTAPVGYLQTSPEFAMKRLLAAGSGDIYHLGPVFRAEESGRHHRAEFTLLEWYRLGFDHHALMDDVAGLLDAVLPGLHIERRAYAEMFHDRYGVDPHRASTSALAACARAAAVELGTSDTDRTVVLDALFAVLLPRESSAGTAMFLYDFPVEQAAYAHVDTGPLPLARRFELVIAGMEIANGYVEITDSGEQAARMEAENCRRTAMGLPSVAPDPALLAALSAGLPACAGVAIGFDRLAMLATGERDIAGVVAFA